MGRSILITCLMLALFSQINLSARDTSPDEDNGNIEIKKWKLKGGINGTYSTGQSPSNFLYTPYLNISCDISVFTLKAGYSRYQNYQITDGKGSFTEISLNNGSLYFNADLNDIFSVSGKIDYLTGSDKYSEYKYSAGGDADFDSFSISCTYTGSAAKYDFNGKIKDTSQGINIDCSYEFNRQFSALIGFDYSTLSYAKVHNSYDKYVVNAEFEFSIIKNFSFSFGPKAGIDSANYAIYGAEAGVDLKVYEKVDLTLTYSNEYFKSPKSKNKIKPEKQNPKLSLDKQNSRKSYDDQTLTFGASVVY